MNPAQQLLSGLLTTSQIGYVPTPVGTLVITDNDNIAREYQVTTSKITIGRSKKNDIVLNSDSISRHHVRLEQRDGAWFLIDLKSTNGTYLAGKRISTQADVLWSADQEVQIGSYRLDWKAQHNSKPLTRQIQPAKDPLPESESSAPVETGRMLVNIRTQQLELMPGERGRVLVDLVHLSTQSASYRVYLTNIPQSWVSLPSNFVTLKPRERHTLPLTIKVPHTGTRAGLQEFQINVDDVAGEIPSAHVAGYVTIKPFHRFQMKVRSEPRRLGKTYYLTVYNAGNTPSIFRIKGNDDTEQFKLRAKQWQIALTPDTEDTMRIHARISRRPLLAAKRRLPLRLEVLSEIGELKTYEDELIVTPLMPLRTVLWASLIVMFAIALIWLVFNLSSGGFASSGPLNVAWLDTILVWLHSFGRSAT